VDQRLSWTATKTVEDGTRFGFNRFLVRFVVCLEDPAAAAEEEGGEYYDD
jgi:hypothetical protein